MLQDKSKTKAACNFKMAWHAINCTGMTLKHTTSAASVVEVDRCRKSLQIKVAVDDIEVAAVVDSAAEVTVLSSS